MQKSIDQNLVLLLWGLILGGEFMCDVACDIHCGHMLSHAVHTPPGWQHSSNFPIDFPSKKNYIYLW